MMMSMTVWWIYFTHQYIFCFYTNVTNSLHISTLSLNGRADECSQVSGFDLCFSRKLCSARIAQSSQLRLGQRKISAIPSCAAAGQEIAPFPLSLSIAISQSSYDVQTEQCVHLGTCPVGILNKLSRRSRHENNRKHYLNPSFDFLKDYLSYHSA